MKFPETTTKTERSCWLSRCLPSRMILYFLSEYTGKLFFLYSYIFPYVTHRMTPQGLKAYPYFKQSPTVKIVLSRLLYTKTDGVFTLRWLQDVKTNKWFAALKCYLASSIVVCPPILRVWRTGRTRLFLLNFLHFPTVFSILTASEWLQLVSARDFILTRTSGRVPTWSPAIHSYGGTFVNALRTILALLRINCGSSP